MLDMHIFYRLVKVPDQKELVTVTSSFSQKGTSSSSFLQNVTSSSYKVTAPEKELLRYNLRSF